MLCQRGKGEMLGWCFVFLKSVFTIMIFSSYVCFLVSWVLHQIFSLFFITGTSSWWFVWKFLMYVYMYVCMKYFLQLITLKIKYMNYIIYISNIYIYIYISNKIYISFMRLYVPSFCFDNSFFTRVALIHHHCYYNQRFH